MYWLYWPFARIPLTLMLLVILAASCWVGYRAAVASWSSNLQDSADFARAPGCMKGADVDTSLPPCMNVPMTVVSKTSHKEHSDVNASGQRLAFDLTLRGPNGQTTRYEDVYENFWDDVQPGETIAAITWEGRVQELDSSNEHYPVFSPSPRTSRLFCALLVCIAAGFLSIGILCEMWFPRLRLFGLLGRRFLT